jgi:hypothetical protein
MTLGPSDGRGGRAPDERMFRCREQRIALLARASQAVLRAQALSESSGRAVAAAGQVTMAVLENLALIEAERAALSTLETDVRRFADALRGEGTPPEVAVRRLKATVEPVVFSFRENDAGDVEWRRTIASDVVRWFVEAYYAA